MLKTKTSLIGFVLCTSISPYAISESDQGWFTEIDASTNIFSSHSSHLKIGKYLTDNVYLSLGAESHSQDNKLSCPIASASILIIDEIYDGFLGGKDHADRQSTYWIDSKCEKVEQKHLAISSGYKLNYWDKFYIKPEIGISRGDGIATYRTEESHTEEDEWRSNGVHASLKIGLDVGDFSLSGGIKHSSFYGHKKMDSTMITPLAVEWRF